LPTTNLAKQTGIYTIGEIAPRIISFFLLPIYTNYLSPSDYGIINYTNSIVVFLYVLGALSLNSYVLRFYYGIKKEKEKKELIGNIYLFIGFINFLILAIAWLIVPLIIEKYNVKIPWKPYFQLALINNFLDGFSIIPLVFYRVKQKAKIFVKLSLGRALLQFLFTFFLIVVLKKGIIGNYLGKFFSVFIYVFIYWIVIKKEAILNINIKQIKEGLKFSLPLIPGALAFLILNISDRIILERYVSLFDIGIYSVAYTLAFALNMIIQSGYKAIEPEFYKRFQQPGFFHFAKKIQSNFLFMIFTLAMFLTLFSQEIFKIMTSDDYFRGYLLVPVIIIGALMSGQNIIFQTILTAEKKTKIVGFTSLIGAGINLTVNLLLIPLWGIYAAAISSSISYCFMNIYSFSRMDFPNKSLKSEIIALILFIAITISIFFGFNVQLSVSIFLLKIAICFAYTFIIAKIFHIDWSFIKNEIQHKKY